MLSGSSAKWDNPILWGNHVQCILEVVRIFLSDQKFKHNPESNEDIHWTHIESKNIPLKPLADHRAADLFWCGPD